MLRSSPTRADRGAAAVEAGLVLSFFLVPLLLGVLYWGQYFWQAQRLPAVDFNLSGDQLSGTYCNEEELVDRVYALLAGNIASIGGQLGLPLSIGDIAVSVVNVLPTVGADLQISVSVPVVDQVASFLPLPNEGAVVQDLTMRLDNVTVGTGSC